MDEQIQGRKAGLEMSELWERILVRTITKRVVCTGIDADAPDAQDLLEVFTLLLDLSTIRVVEEVEKEYQRFIRDGPLTQVR